MISVAVLNESTVVNDGDLPAVVSALQQQVTNDFAPAWGIDADIHYVPRGATPNPAAWQLVILDDSDQAGALGYHDVTSQGLPLGKVFAKTTQQDGGQWTVTASHELLEILADPEINLSVFIQHNATSGRIFAYEVCDAVEETSYNIGNVQVSNFVFPSYFEPGTAAATPQAPFDFLKLLKAPLPALLPGGYMSFFNVGRGSGWRQETDMSAVHSRMVPQDGSRRHRRMTPLEQRRRSVR
jgi:hypothetical protein